MWRFLVRIAIVCSLVVFLAQCGTSGGHPGEQEQIPESVNTVTFEGITWSDVVFKHAEHSTRNNSECIKCHACEPITGATHWYCRACHTTGTDLDNRCDEYPEHGCIMTQCNDCHKEHLATQAPQGQNCTACHTGGQVPTGDVQKPTVPTGLTATAASTSQIDLSWSASTDNVAVVGYKIYRGGAYITSVSGTSHSDTGLSAGTSYCYQVSAYDAASNESSLSTVSCATTNAAADTLAPTVPTGLTATVFSPTQTDLAWQPSTDNVGVAGYKIYRGGVFIQTVTTGTSFSDTVPANTQYCYTVSAYDAAPNESAQSAPVCTAATVAAGTSLVLQDLISQASEVDHWTLTVDPGGTLVIDVLAYESCGPSGKWSPTDYFNDGADNNRLVANIFLFKNDGTLVDSTTGADYGNGMYPGEKRPGAHYTTSAKNPYLTITITPGIYVLAIGSYPISENNAWAGENNDGSSWKDFEPYPAPGTILYNKYKITITLN